MGRLRRYFATGLVVVLPMYLTVYFLIVIFHFMNGILGNFINLILRRYLGFSIPCLGFILLLFFIPIVGFLANKFVGRLFIPFFEKFFLKFPLSRSIYPAAKQIIQFLFSGMKMSFKKVVLIEYPRKGIWSVGFITNDGFKDAREKTGQDLINVFVASTPNPLTGFYIIIERSDVKILDISIEDGLRLIVSGGVVNPAGG